MPGMTERKRYMREETTTARGDYEPNMGKAKNRKKARKDPSGDEPNMGKAKNRKKAAKKPQDQEPDMGKAKNKKKYRRP